MVVRSHKAARHLSRRRRKRNSGADPCPTRCWSSTSPPVVRVDRRRDPRGGWIVHQLVSADIAAVLQHPWVLPYFAIGIGSSAYYIVAGAGMDRSQAAEAAAAAPAAVLAPRLASAGPGIRGSRRGHHRQVIAAAQLGENGRSLTAVGSASAPLVSSIVEQPEARWQESHGRHAASRFGHRYGGAGLLRVQVTVMSPAPFAEDNAEAFPPLQELQDTYMPDDIAAADPSRR